MVPNSTPIMQWKVKEKNRLSFSRFLKLFLIPAMIFPVFAGFNPAAYTESDVMPLLKPLVRLIYLLFEKTIIVESETLFIIISYFFMFIASYFFLAVLFIPILFFISLISDKTNCFAIYTEGIAKGEVMKSVSHFDSFLTWDKINSYSDSSKNELRVADRKNKTLMYLYYEKHDENNIKYYLDYYLKHITQN